MSQSSVSQVKRCCGPSEESEWHRAKVLALESQSEALSSVVIKWMGDRYVLGPPFVYARKKITYAR